VIAIFDIDGTLTTSGDTPREPLIAAMRRMAENNELEAMIVSARPISRLDETRRWLVEHDVPHTRVYLNDFSETTGPNVALEFKRYKYEKLIAELGDDLELAVDNDADVRAMAVKLDLEAMTPQEFIAMSQDTMTRGAELKRAAFASEYKALDEGPIGRFSGYGSVFGAVDAYGDVVLPGAFTDTLKRATESGRMPAMLWQHNPTMPIGVWRTMREDAKGLYVEGELADTQLGREAYSLLKMGALSGLSIGFNVVDEAFNRNTNTRELRAVNLWEVSPVTFPANGDARVAQVKFAGSAMTVREFERFLRDAGGFSISQAKSIAARGYQALRDEVAEDDSTEWLAQLAARFTA
jgi:HK97 family phage prohead protease